MSRTGSFNGGRQGGPSSALVLLDEADRVADGLDVAELVVGDGDTELVLDRGGDLDHRQGVDVEVVGERLLRGGVGGGDAGDLLQDLGDACLDLLGAAHAWGPLCRMVARPRTAPSSGTGVPARSVVYQGRRRTCPAKVSPAP